MGRISVVSIPTLRSDINPSWDLRYIATQCDIRYATDIFASQMWDLYHIAATTGSNIAVVHQQYRAEQSEAYRLFPHLPKSKFADGSG